MDSIYSKFAISLCNAQTKQDAHKLIDEDLIGKLEPLFPTFSAFSERFSDLLFSKEYLASNVKTKYALYQLQSYYSNTECFEHGLTVEHIIPESISDNNRNIGNLILIEDQLNNEAGEKSYQEKKVIYEKSKSPWIKSFIETYSDWDESMFANRAMFLAKTYYEKILGRTIPNNEDDNS